jgi:dihydroxy-acid dehydratase
MMSTGYVSPEAAECGLIAHVETGDMIDIDIPNRTISLRVDDAVIATRRKAQEATGFKAVKKRKPNITNALKAYAALTTSAAKGAVRRMLS